MELDSLRLFIEVMRQGSFAEVARREAVDPSTISRTIHSLEQELGVRLFQRTTRKLAPTESGLMYYQRTEPLLEQLLQASESLKNSEKSPSGLLRISVPVTFGLHALIPALPEFSQRYPALRFDIQLNDHYVDLVQDRFDAALRVGTLADSSMIAVKLCPMNFSLCATPQYLEQYGHPQTPEQLLKHKLLAFPPDHYRICWKFRKQGEVQELSLKPLAQISNGQALYHCALQHMGIGLLSHYLVGEDILAGRLEELLKDHDITPTEFDQSVFVLYPSRNYLPPKVQVFVNFLKEKFASPQEKITK